MTLKNKNFTKPVSLLICVAVYATALASAFVTAGLLKGHHILLTAFAADVAATVVVFISSIVFNNSSMYDPYWSAAPPAVALYFLLSGGAAETISIRNIAVIILVCLWSLRLTYNWIRQWRGLVHEDWRYVDIRNKTGNVYWATSFVGIHFFPTVQVFLGCLSLYPVLVLGGGSSALLDITAVLVIIGAVWIEARADKELDIFKKTTKGPGQVLSTGIWAWSRHPNYFGEISFWWGLFLFSLSSEAFRWWTITGPLFITVMFLFISIPMMEKHILARKPAFKEYMKKTSMLVPWFPQK